MTVFIIPALIYFLSVFLWIRYLYKHSLKKQADRIYTAQKILDFAIYIPVGLQAIFLFCFAVFQFIPLSNQLYHFIETVFLGNKEAGFCNFDALKIIFIGSVVVMINHAVIKTSAALKSNPGTDLLYKSLIFFVSIFLLRLLVLNIWGSFTIRPALKLLISYNNNYLLLPSVLSVILFSILKGRLIHKNHGAAVKYYSLGLLILLLYSLLIITITLPLVGCLIIKNIF